ncbi:MAG TPA: LLM class flavin-dependent oxidoreductase [Halobacteria archaeon]|nr:LLM class flavin-dependent oxidoreductase [Halobacteria archaeon]
MKRIKFGTVGPTFPPIENLWKTPKKNEEQGYDSIWFPDHLMGWYPQSIWLPEITSMAKVMPSPHMYWDAMISMALAARDTSKILIGSSVTEAVRRHPAMIAQEIVTIDNVSKGRAILGIGAGEGENISPYGLSHEKPVSRLEEALKIIKLLFDSKMGETIDFDGKIWRFKDAVFDTPLYNGHKPPIYIGGSGKRMIRLTAEYADGWIPPMQTVDDYRERLRLLDDTAKKFGRGPNDIKKGLFASYIIDKDVDSCIDLMKSPLIRVGSLELPSESFEKYGIEHPLGKNFNGLLDYIPSRLSKEQVLDAVKKIPDEVVMDRYIYGGPDDVIDKIDAYRKIGLEHLIIWNETFFADFSKVKSSYGYMKEVMNYFKDEEE